MTHGILPMAQGSPLSNGTTGAVSELLLAADLMRRGIPVFRALSPSCVCDLIAIVNGVTVRVECRTATTRHKNGGVNVPIKDGDFARTDAFALWVRDENLPIYIPDLHLWGVRRATPQDMEAVVKPRYAPTWLQGEPSLLAMLPFLKGNE